MWKRDNQRAEEGKFHTKLTRVQLEGHLFRKDIQHTVAIMRQFNPSVVCNRDKSSRFFAFSSNLIAVPAKQ